MPYPGKSGSEINDSVSVPYPDDSLVFTQVSIKARDLIIPVEIKSTDADPNKNECSEGAKGFLRLSPSCLRLSTTATVMLPL